MVLGFSPKFPNGNATRFVEKILAYFLPETRHNNIRIKIHTIRQDKHDRWKAERLIHFSTGVRTKKYKCFYKAPCISTQEVIIDSHREVIHIMKDGCRVETLQGKITEIFAYNDGFDSVKDFWDWFRDYQGSLKLIHWTNLKY